MHDQYIIYYAIIIFCYVLYFHMYACKLHHLPLFTSFILTSTAIDAIEAASLYLEVRHTNLPIYKLNWLNLLNVCCGMQTCMFKWTTQCSFVYTNFHILQNIGGLCSLHRTRKKNVALKNISRFSRSVTMRRFVHYVICGTLMYLSVVYCFVVSTSINEQLPYWMVNSRFHYWANFCTKSAHLWVKKKHLQWVGIFFFIEYTHTH